MKTAALVPAYEAAATIGDVVEATRAVVEPVLVVDDGSGDGTAGAAERAGAQLVRHPANRGKGAAILTGLARLQGMGVERAVTLDADGQHLPREIPRLLAVSDATPDALIVGVRRREGLDIRPVALLGNHVADLLLHAIAGRPLPDTQSGFRVYPVAATLALGASATGFDFETEVLLRAVRAGMDVVGVPVEVHYPPAQQRTSHYRPWEDTLRIVATVLRVLGESIPGAFARPHRFR